MTLLLLLSLARPGLADTSVQVGNSVAIEIATQTRDIIVRTTASSQVAVRNGSIEVAGATVEINEDDHPRHGSSAGPLDVSVPAGARVEVNSVGGSITLIGTPARMDAETVNGTVDVQGGSGSLDITAVDGVVTVKDFHGTHLSIDATADDVNVTNASGVIEVDNVNGAVTLRGIHSSSVTATTVNDAVLFEGDIAPTGNYEFSTQNGDVTLVIPLNTSARLRMSTLNGSLDTKIPATTGGHADGRAGSTHPKRGDDGEQTFTVTYGSGSATITVDAFNGTVTVRPPR